MEALLRPPVELWSTATALAAGILAWLAPWALMMPPAYRGGHRVDLLRVWRVARASGLARTALPTSHEAPAGISRAGRTDPVSRHKLFLGKAFAGHSNNTRSGCAIR